MDLQRLIDFLIKHRFFLAITVVLLLIVWVLSQYSFITVDVSRADNNEITYQFINQKTGKATSATTNDISITRLLPKASYEVTVFQKSKTAFAVTSSPGFLRKSTVTASLTPQPSRSFVGNSPAGCMYYSSNILYSYGCEGSSDITIHLPATASQPTYNIKSTDYIGTIEGIVSTPTGVIALAQKPVGGDTGDGGSNQHIAYSLGNRAVSRSNVALSSLNNSDSYSIVAFRQGFLVYNESFTDIEYYSSLTAHPQKINIDGPQDPEQQPLSLTASGNSILVAYSDKADYENNTDSKGIGKVKSQLFLYGQGSAQNFSFKMQLNKVEACGASRLCALDSENKEMSVYDISGNKPVLSYKVQDAQDILLDGKRLLVLRSEDLISLDAIAGSGSVAYSFNGYSSCGIQVNGASYLLCLSDKKGGDSSVVYVDPASSNSDQIDTKLLKLRASPDIKEASVYGRYIFISPNLGDVEYYAASGGFDYNPAVKASAKTNINRLIDSLDLRSRFIVTVNGL